MELIVPENVLTHALGQMKIKRKRVLPIKNIFRIIRIQQKVNLDGDTLMK
jgi:hypothetical protein